MTSGCSGSGADDSSYHDNAYLRRHTALALASAPVSWNAMRSAESYSPLAVAGNGSCYAADETSLGLTAARARSALRQRDQGSDPAQ